MTTTTKRKARKSKSSRWPEGLPFERYEAHKQKIALKILKAARAKGWTVEVLAEWSGVSTTSIYRLERGETRFPRFDTLEKLAVATGYSGLDLY